MPAAARGWKMASDLKGERLEAVPIKQRVAFDFIEEHHRHHNVPVGSLFVVGVGDEDGVLRGVAVVGRPVARMLDDGLTCEVTRLCTDGYPNACSFLYSRCRRIAIERGYRRGVTYILSEEDGGSLRASGWHYLGESGGGTWNRPSRSRSDPNPTTPKRKYGWGSWPELIHPATEAEKG